MSQKQQLIGAIEDERARTTDALLAALATTSDADLAATTPFMVGPKAIGPVPKGAIVQFMLNDHIHHRGQLSVYLRMTGSKVPSIYGPSKDEPWS